MTRMIRCLSCGDPCLLDESLDGVLCPECCEDMGFDDEYVQEDEDGE